MTDEQIIELMARAWFDAHLGTKSYGDADKLDREEAHDCVKAAITALRSAGMAVVPTSEAATLDALAKRFAAKAEAHDAAARLILEKALVIERQQGVRPRKKYEAKAREERLAKMDRMVERELRVMINTAEGKTE